MSYNLLLNCNACMLMPSLLTSNRLPDDNKANSDPQLLQSEMSSVPTLERKSVSTMRAGNTTNSRIYKEVLPRQHA